jgi:hypothetical protein
MMYIHVIFYIIKYIWYTLPHNTLDYLPSIFLSWISTVAYNQILFQELDPLTSQAFPLAFLLMGTCWLRLSSDNEDNSSCSINTFTMGGFHPSHFMCSKGSGKGLVLCLKMLALLIWAGWFLESKGSSVEAVGKVVWGWVSILLIPVWSFLACVGLVGLCQAFELIVSLEYSPPGGMTSHVAMLADAIGYWATGSSDGTWPAVCKWVWGGESHITLFW